MIESINKQKNSQTYLSTSNPLLEVVSKAMIKRMAHAAISYNLLFSEYQKGEKYAIDLLEHRSEGKVQVIKSKKVLNGILNYLRQNS